MGEYGNSSWSEWAIFSTKLELTMQPHENAILIVRGTGSRNHATSQLYIDDNLILDRGDFRGLYLSVHHRHNLSQVFNATYDTMKVLN